MDNSNSKNKPEEKKGENPYILIMPERANLGKWYGVQWQAVLRRLDKEGVKINDRIFTEKDIGAIFYTSGLPPFLPIELYEWAKALKEDYFRLYAKNPPPEK